MATAIFYASSTGNTEDVAKKIAKHLGIEDVFNIGDKDILLAKNYDKLIFGSSTWGEGDLQDDWDTHWENFEKIDFTGKTVALFGLGDQDSYCDNFVDAMGKIYQVVIKNGAKVVGFWDVDDYRHDLSLAQVDDKFVGLALDEDNDSELSDTRIVKWCDTIKNEIV